MSGPASSDPDLAYRYCGRLARQHPENFFIGSLLMPRSKRRHLSAVYAYARLADDIADGDLPTAAKLEALDLWERRLDDCLAGRATHPVFVALARTIPECELPVEPLRNLLVAFRSDAAFQPFATFEDLLGYCRNSANPVGRLVLALFGIRDEELCRLSDEICTALQLTNFWQDLGVDLGRGRLYLPLEDLVRFGVDRRQLESIAKSPPHPASGRPPPKGERRNFHLSLWGEVGQRPGEGESPAGLTECLRFQVDRTRELFRRGLPLAERCPPKVGREVRMFAAGGLRILARLEADGFAPLARRPRLTRGDKVRLLRLGLVGA